jgi:hypothetical protein
VIFKVTPDKPARLKLGFRIPHWLSGEFIPGGLYTYEDDTSPDINVRVKGELIEYSTSHDLVIEREWEAGDEIEIDFPMQVRTVMADPRVESNRDKLAIVRGPLVYAAEGIDNEGSAFDITLAGDETFVATYMPGLLKGVISIRSDKIKLIPYYSWANRESSDMRVWIPVRDLSD